MLQDKKLAEIPAYKSLLTTFTNKEIIRWPLLDQAYGAEIQAHADIFGGACRGFQF